MAVYDITFEVTDPQLTAVELRKALAQFGEVLEITKWKSGDVDSAASGGEVGENQI